MSELLQHPLPKYQKLSNILSTIDIILAVIIIFTGSMITTPLGGATLLFGLCMLAIVTTFKILKKW